MLLTVNPEQHQLSTGYDTLDNGPTAPPPYSAFQQHSVQQPFSAANQMYPQFIQPIQLPRQTTVQFPEGRVNNHVRVTHARDCCCCCCSCPFWVCCLIIGLVSSARNWQILSHKPQIRLAQTLTFFQNYIPSSIIDPTSNLFTVIDNRNKLERRRRIKL